MQNKIVCSMLCNSSLCFGCFHCGNGTLGMLHACASVTNYVHAPVCWSIISFALIKNKLRAQTNYLTKYSQMLPCTAGQMQHVVGPIHIPFCATHIKPTITQQTKYVFRKRMVIDLTHYVIPMMLVKLIKWINEFQHAPTRRNSHSGAPNN